MGGFGIWVGVGLYSHAMARALLVVGRSGESALLVCLAEGTNMLVARPTRNIRPAIPTPSPADSRQRGDRFGL